MGRLFLIPCSEFFCFVLVLFLQWDFGILQLQLTLLTRIYSIMLGIADYYIVTWPQYLTQGFSIFILSFIKPIGFLKNLSGLSEPILI